jgi:hypothetical protein
MNGDLSYQGSAVGIPATIVTWLSYMNIMKLTPFFQFLVSILSLVWLVIQIVSWAKKNLKMFKKNAKK